MTNRNSKTVKEEILIYARGRWEIAFKNFNEAIDKWQWFRRDGSWICFVGDEFGTAPLPQADGSIDHCTGSLLTFAKSNDR